MKKGFSLIEMIISIGLITLLFSFSLIIFKNSKESFADPYENIRLIISDAANVYLNSNVGNGYKELLYENGEILLNTNELINDGLLEESYFVNNINEEKNISNIEIVVSLNEDGVINYSINIV